MVTPLDQVNDCIGFLDAESHALGDAEDVPRLDARLEITHADIAGDDDLDRVSAEGDDSALRAYERARPQERALQKGQDAIARHHEGSIGGGRDREQLLPQQASVGPTMASAVEGVDRLNH